MPICNVHLLSADEHKYFNEKYRFSIKDDSVLVQINGFNRTTAHPLTKSFSLKTPVRKLTISTQALKIWSENFYGNIRYQVNKVDKYTLIDVQNAINILIVSYQEINFENVLDVLKNHSEK